MSNERPENPNSTLSEGLKRKRGRPKKQPQEDGGNTAVIPEDAVEPQPAKKRRGRPKGSKKATGLTGGTPQAVAQEEGESEGGNSLESSDWNLNSAPAAQGATGKDGSKSSKTIGVRRALE
ncbi:high mobility group protein HMGI-C-like protein [Turdus rufiventris]|nr:high mobility group protein HMGI-C-like protein [Turdus rufiventris]